jgi:hypothetical protein
MKFVCSPIYNNFLCKEKKNEKKKTFQKDDQWGEQEK